MEKASRTTHKSDSKKQVINGRWNAAGFVSAGVALMLILVPFHAFLTVWVSSLVGHYTLLRLWKEMLLVVLGLAAFWFMLQQSRLRSEVRHAWLFKLMIAYLLVQLLLGLAAYIRHDVSTEALGEGLIEDMRLMVIFFVAWVASSYSPWLRGHWRELLLIPAAIVVCFGLLQVFILPVNFLVHFGYGASTISPYQLVDLNDAFVRVQSTLRGANPLGAYLVVILAAVSALNVQRLILKGRIKRGAKGTGQTSKNDEQNAMIKGRSKRKHKSSKAVIPAKAGIQSKYISATYLRPRNEFWMIVLGIGALIDLYFTYSRSAYIGASVAIGIVLWQSIKGKKTKRMALAAAAVFIILGFGSVLLLRHDTTFENTFFHTSQLSHSPQSSNQDRSSDLEQGLHDVIHEPFGFGPGSAGPASMHNNHPARISEDYFLQIGQETGWLGLALFVGIIFLIAKKLWQKRRDEDRLPLVLFASLIGLTVVNLLSHAWADDTLAYLWWGLAGVALPLSISNKNSNRNLGK